MNVIKPSAPMRSSPDVASNLETECLFGETISVLDNYLDWYFCRLLTDNYCGWIQKKYLGEIVQSTHRVFSNRTYLFRGKDVKSGCINYLPLGAQIRVEDFDDFWAEVYVGGDKNQKFGYIPRKHIIKNGKKIDDWVSIAERLMGTPYVWGGRNSIGLDCSALLQLSYQTYGENIPRNSADQSLLNKKVIKNKENLQRGFVIFWEGHVGIMVDEIHCIHANAFHMEVSREPLVNILERSGDRNPIIKIMNFN
jgi:hypothetical protein